MAIDPVCGMTVNENEAAGVSDYEGKCYYFCSEICQDEFGEDPEQFISSTELEAPSAAYGNSSMG